MAAADFDLPKLRELAEPHVFMIESLDADGKPVAFGTGFVVQAPEGPVGITNAHVLKGASRVFCKLADGRRLEASGVGRLSDAEDLATLWMITPTTASDFGQFPASHGFSWMDTPKPALELETNQAIVGEPIAVLGNPLNYADTLSDGIISALRKNENGGIGFIQITAPISPGSSGSPVLNSQGKVIGIATMTREDGQALNFAISSKDINAFLSRSPKQVEFSAIQNSESIQISEKYKKALDAYRANNIPLAISTIKEILGKQPDHIFSRILLSKAYASIEMFGKAQALAERLVIEAPENPETWLQLGNCAVHAKNYPLAVKHYKTVAGMSPYHETAWDMLAMIYEYLNKKQDQAFALSQAKAARKYNETGIETIKVPFNFSWGETSARFQESLKRLHVTEVERNKAGGRLCLSVQGIPQPLLQKALFYFKNDSLNEIELYYGDPKWGSTRSGEFFDQTKTNIQNKFGPGHLLRREKFRAGKAIQIIICYEWMQDITTLNIVFHTIQSGTEWKSLQALHYRDSRIPKLNPTPAIFDARFY